MTDQQRNNLTTAMFSSSFPINPIPFANGLSEMVMNEGTDAIESNDAKRILWVLMAQAYGQLATIDLSSEWERLYQTEEKKD
tara:strand:+ start:813 stop:1058 length:246 start_codon:yes stop_codon:yes gene_type:complete